MSKIQEEQIFCAGTGGHPGGFYPKIHFSDYGIEHEVCLQCEGLHKQSAFSQDIHEMDLKVKAHKQGKKKDQLYAKRKLHENEVLSDFLINLGPFTTSLLLWSAKKHKLDLGSFVSLYPLIDHVKRTPTLDFRLSNPPILTEHKIMKDCSGKIDSLQIRALYDKLDINGIELSFLQGIKEAPVFCHYSLVDELNAKKSNTVFRQSMYEYYLRGVPWYGSKP